MGQNPLDFCCCLSLMIVTHDGSFCFCIVTFIYELKVDCFPHLCIFWMLSSQEELCCFFWEPWGAIDLVQFYFYHLPSHLHFIQDSQVPIYYPLRTAWFSAFTIRAAMFFHVFSAHLFLFFFGSLFLNPLKIVLSFHLPINEKKITLYAGFSFFLHEEHLLRFNLPYSQK